MQIFTTALCIIVKKNENKISIKRLMDKQLWNIYTMEYYLTLKINELLIPATIWKNLNDMLRERSHTQNST